MAVIIGNKHYSHGRVPAVDYAHRDADAFESGLLDVLRYGEENIIYLRDVTKAKLESAFGIKVS